MIEAVSEMCTGCRACEQICLVSCISIKKDENGFLYPEADTKKCLKCGKCLKVCHAAAENKEQLLFFQKQRTALYGWSKENSIQMKSSSGGAFTELASLWAEQNGVVIGAAFTEDHHYVHHIACSEKIFLL